MSIPKMSNPREGGCGLESRPRHTKDVINHRVSVAIFLGTQHYKARTGKYLLILLVTYVHLDPISEWNMLPFIYECESDKRGLWAFKYILF